MSRYRQEIDGGWIDFRYMLNGCESPPWLANCCEVERYDQYGQLLYRYIDRACPGHWGDPSAEEPPAASR